MVVWRKHTPTGGFEAHFTRVLAVCGCEPESESESEAHAFAGQAGVLHPDVLGAQGAP